MMNIPEAVFGLGCGIVAIALAALVAGYGDEKCLIRWALWATVVGTIIALVAFVFMH